MATPPSQRGVLLKLISTNTAIVQHRAKDLATTPFLNKKEKKKNIIGKRYTHKMQPEKKAQFIKIGVD